MHLYTLHYHYLTSRQVNAVGEGRCQLLLLNSLGYLGELTGIPGIQGVWLNIPGTQEVWLGSPETRGRSGSPGTPSLSRGPHSPQKGQEN